MYTVEYTNRFRKDLKLCQKRGKDLDLLRSVIKILVVNGKLPAKYRPQILSGKFEGKWECYVQPDWLLVWEQYDDQLRMIMTNTGTHSDLF